MRLSGDPSEPSVLDNVHGHCMRAHSLGPEDGIYGEGDVNAVNDLPDGEDLGGGQDNREVNFEGSWF